jgi:hypothetical protein
VKLHVGSKLGRVSRLPVDARRESLGGYGIVQRPRPKRTMYLAPPAGSNRSGFDDDSDVQLPGQVRLRLQLAVHKAVWAKRTLLDSLDTN